MRTLAPALLAAALTVNVHGHQPVFRSGVDIVRFDVRVTDAAGKPITDLRPDEVQIIENGRPLPILLFQHLTEPSERYAQAALRSVSAEVSSNRGAPRGHLYLLVFDQAHITPGNEQIARRAAEAFITTRFRSSDRIAVIGIPGPGPELGFTADRTRAVAELVKVQAALERNVKGAAGNLSVHEAYEIAAGNDRVLADVLVRQSVDLSADVGAVASGITTASDRASRRAATEEPTAIRRVIVENARTVVAQADASARDSLERLSDLIVQYRTVEGRKTVVFFSEGFHQRNVSRELEQVAAAAAQSYAVFYSFDLNRRAGADISQALTPSTTAATEVASRTEPLGSLAAETDGALISDATTHLDAALGRIADQAQDYYVVGFTPSDAALAARGSYRRVSVKVTRPGARASARTGYATPKAAPLDRRRAIDAALAAPFAQQALRVEYTTYTMRTENAGRARVILSLEADLPLRDENHQTGDVVFVVRDMRDGRVVASGTDTIRLPVKAAGSAPTGVGRHRVHFEVPPGTYLMRAVVREPGGLVGSADRRLDVRAVSGPDVAVSDVMLASATGPLPVRAVAYTEDGVSGMVEAYGRAPDQLEGLAVTASLVGAGSDRPIATVRADTQATLGAGTAGVVRRSNFAFTLRDVPPGAYVTRVKVLSGSETLADLTRELEVVAGKAVIEPSDPDAATPPPSDILNGDFVRKTREDLRLAATAGAVRATKGFDLFTLGKYKLAAIELAAALELEPTRAAIAFVLGWAHEGAGQRREAIGAWRAAAANDPRMIPAHLALADAYLRMSEHALAAQAVRAGLAAVPDSPELQAKLAAIKGGR